MKYSPFVFKILLACGTWLSCLSALGQSPSDLALKNIQKQKWQRAHYLLTKAVAKDSLNVTAKYVLAQYFFSEDNPVYHLDSAYHQVSLALHDFQQSSIKQRERLKRFPVDSLLLVKLRQRIDSTAFQRGKDAGTKDALDHFIVNFPTSPWQPFAIAFRDSVVYEQVTRVNTLEAFQNFLRDYPDASQKKMALDNYEKLLFKNRTADQKLESFESFIADYPQSPFRRLAEKFIFEYQTASGDMEAFHSFIRKYPHSPFAKMAKNILFHLSPEDDRDQFLTKDFSNDSIARVIHSENFYLVPILRKGKFGFMDSQGTETIPAQYDSIDDRYRCGNITDDFITLPDKVVAKNGALIWAGPASETEDIGYGFLLIKNEDCPLVIHKSGFKIPAKCVDDARILSGKFIGTKKQGYWSVWTLTGRLLAEHLEDLFWIKNVLAFKSSGKFNLITSDSLSKLSTNPIRVDHQFDDVRPWPGDLIFVRQGDDVGLLNQRLKFIVPLGTHTLSPMLSGVIVSSSEGKSIYNNDGEISRSRFENVITHDKWIAVKSASLWRFYDLVLDSSFTVSYDTVMFAGPFAIGQRKDSITFFFSNVTAKQWDRSAIVEFVPGRDSLAFVSIVQGERRNVYDETGQRLFSVLADKIQYVGPGLFTIQRNEKKGLISSSGKQLIPIEYDAIGTSNNSQVSLLKSTKFGSYDVRKGRLIKPLYSKNIAPYNADYNVAYKDGSYGFVNWKNKFIGKFEFSDIQFWNDTSALVKKNSNWMIIEIESNKILVDKIKDYRFIQNTAHQKLAILHQADNYGVFHNTKGTIIPSTFSYILNVGSAEDPLYFTEKHVKEASIFVVIYYNKDGIMIHKEIYDHDDYDKIYCDHR